MLNFCTLFNSNYAAKGLAMYESLERVCPAFHLYIFAFDDECVEILRKLNLRYATIITLMEFEDKELLRVKPTRTRGEYCWTCTSSTILYCLKHFKIDSCTYLDADLYFYSNPQVLINEMGMDDVLITPHRYSTPFKIQEKAGKYCVQFMTFRNTENGLKVLQWWREACLEWCYGRMEDGKFGDQKYLDDWTSRFEGVHELKHLGGGVAPWNMQQYVFTKETNGICGTEIASRNQFMLVFYHFHACKCFRKGVLREFFYEWDGTLDADTKRVVYKPYIRHLKKCYRRIKQMSNIDGLATQVQPIQSWWSYLMRIRHRWMDGENRYSYWLDF